jgi:CRISPR-associated protein Csm3
VSVDTAKSIKLKGKVFIEGRIRALTGLHIGAGRGAIEIGGQENAVVRDPLTDRPYIPGSSLKGKVRSLLERRDGLPLNQRIGQVRIHICADPESFRTCAVCHIFGIPGEKSYAEPTRLVVRDVFLTEESARHLGDLDLDAPYTETKSEVAIDRVTSQANPRQVERVPAGAEFGLAQLVLSVYEGDDRAWFRTLVEGLVMLEDDYLGGYGSRGSGRVEFRDLVVGVRPAGPGGRRQDYGNGRKFDSLPDLLAELDQVMNWLGVQLGGGW